MRLGTFLAKVSPDPSWPCTIHHRVCNTDVTGPQPKAPTGRMLTGGAVETHLTVVAPREHPVVGRDGDGVLVGQGSRRDKLARKVAAHPRQPTHTHCVPEAQRPTLIVARHVQRTVRANDAQLLATVAWADPWSRSSQGARGGCETDISQGGKWECMCT
jgi:hypothetical protein